MLRIIAAAQRAGFTLDQIRHLMPAGSHGWKHDELADTLKKKVAEIDRLQKRLAQNKAQLQAVIKGLESRPKGSGCSENKKRVLDLLILDNGKLVKPD